MKFLILTILLVPTLSFTPITENWFDDFDSAMEKAKVEEKPILMVFSGSDWCRPCIKLRQDVLEQSDFETYANENLILLEVDFPRKKKNRLMKVKQQHNEKLAERYNPKGYFPQVLLLNQNGEVMKVFDLPISSSAEFIYSLKSVL